VIERFLDTLEKYPTTEEQPVPEDWPATQVLLRAIAEDLMLCKDLDSTVHKMREDKATLWILVALMTELDFGFYISTLQRAFAFRPAQSDILPGQAYATYLLELAKGPPPIWAEGSREFYES
jgi:hypothetical protein